MTGGSVNKEAGILSRANELEKLTAQEKELTEKLNAAELELQEAQRSVDQVAFQMSTAAEQLRQAEDQVLRLQGQEKQHEVLVNAITEAEGSARREWESLESRERADRERYTTQQTKLQIYNAQLEQTQQKIAALESSQSEASETMAGITEQMTLLRTDEAALEAERYTAQNHISDMEQLRGAMEGDREKKLALRESILQDTQRIEAEIKSLQQRSAQNNEDAEQVRKEMKQIITQRAEAEAAKTRSEREAQEKNKDILNM